MDANETIEALREVHKIARRHGVVGVRPDGHLKFKKAERCDCGEMMSRHSQPIASDLCLKYHLEHGWSINAAGRLVKNEFE